MAEQGGIRTLRFRRARCRVRWLHCKWTAHLHDRKSSDAQAARHSNGSCLTRLDTSRVDYHSPAVYVH